MELLINVPPGSQYDKRWRLTKRLRFGPAYLNVRNSRGLDFQRAGMSVSDALVLSFERLLLVATQGPQVRDDFPEALPERPRKALADQHPGAGPAVDRIRSATD